MTSKGEDSYKSRGKLEFKKEAPQQEEPYLPGFAKAGPGKGVSAYERHKKFINDYIIFYGREKEYLSTRPEKTDYDVIREEYRFLRTEEDNDDSQFEKRLSKKYYDKLFKEYCLADLSRYKHGQIGLRWRTEKEVFTGKGQFVCGNKKCDERDKLSSYELPFAYKEAGENKTALVKLLACPKCAEMVTYYHNKKNHKDKVKKEEIEGEKETLRITDRGERESRKRQLDKDVKEEEEIEGKRQKSNKELEEEEEKERQVSNPWKAKAQVEKTKDEEFDEYFEGLFP